MHKLQQFLLSIKLTTIQQNVDNMFCVATLPCKNKKEPDHNVYSNKQQNPI